LWGAALLVVFFAVVAFALFFVVSAFGAAFFAFFATPFFFVLLLDVEALTELPFRKCGGFAAGGLFVLVEGITGAGASIVCAASRSTSSARRFEC